MTWQQSPFPEGMSVPGAGPHTMQFCLTQAWIDRFGAPVPQTRNCQVTNVVKKDNGITADMVCTGPMSGKGTMESTMVDSDHAKGKVHFTGTMQMGQTSKPVESTTVSSSVFKSSDCGNVKPPPLPPDKPDK